MYCDQAFYSIYVMEQFSCTFCEILGTKIGDYSPKIPLPSTLYSIHVCKKNTSYYDDILVTGIDVDIVVY